MLKFLIVFVCVFEICSVHPLYADNKEKSYLSAMLQMQPSEIKLEILDEKRELAVSEIAAVFASKNFNRLKQLEKGTIALEELEIAEAKLDISLKEIEISKTEIAILEVALHMVQGDQKELSLDLKATWNLRSRLYFFKAERARVNTGILEIRLARVQKLAVKNFISQSELEETEMLLGIAKANFESITLMSEYAAEQAKLIR